MPMLELLLWARDDRARCLGVDPPASSLVIMAFRLGRLRFAKSIRRLSLRIPFASRP
jgi:hypothetical protein